MTDDEQPAGPRAAGLNQQAIDWAWAQPIANNPGARITLLCLARLVDEAWECEASQEDMAVEAMLSSRTVRRQLEQLEADGFVARLKRFDGKGYRLPDRCRLNPELALPDNLSGGSDQQKRLPANLSDRDAAQRTDCPVVKMATGSDQEKSESVPEDRLSGGQDALWTDCPVGDEADPEKASSGPEDRLTTGQSVRAVVVVKDSSSSKEEEQNLSTTKGGAGGKRARQTSEEHPRFAEWYAAYPLRKERAAAVKAFSKAAAKVEDVQILFDAAKLYADTDPYVLRGFIKNPATWLNKGCWLDEPAPRLALVPDGSPSPGSTPQQFTEEEYRAGW